MNKTLPLAKSEDFVVQELKNEVLIYNLKTNKALCLNSTASFIWNKCVPNSNYQDVINEFEKVHHQKIDDDFIDLVLDELSKADLLQGKRTFLNEKVSIREVLLRYGLMAVALPMIINVIAPTAAQSASGAPEPLCAAVVPLQMCLDQWGPTSTNCPDDGICPAGYMCSSCCCVPV
ncbi:MAG TPA: hypothetical protein PKY82_34470 [Pyrinomonadaceae bacterium]|nr:hypothetical protein [Pyrinomonadaceae bacterium]